MKLEGLRVKFMIAGKTSKVNGTLRILLLSRTFYQIREKDWWHYLEH